MIAAILITWMALNGPSKEDIARNKRIKDSVELAVKKAQAEMQAKELALVKAADSAGAVAKVLPDSMKQARHTDQYKDFALATTGKEELITLENEHIKAYISTKGGRVASVELKQYKRYGKTEPLILFDKDSSAQAIVFDAYANTRKFSTDSFYFKPVSTVGSQALTLRLETSKPGAYIEFKYALKPGDYMLSYDVNFVGMQDIIANNADQVSFKWQMNMPSQEKHISKEREAATVYYKYTIEKPDYISPQKNEEFSLNEANIKWLAYKQQFFNATVIAETEFLKDGSYFRTSSDPASLEYVKNASAELGIPYNHSPAEHFAMKFYFGPNRYNTLVKYDLGLEKIVPTGWSIFSYINKIIIIPLFDWLSALNMGIVILVLTLIVKVLLFPIAYKTYMSSAKMRALKPETDEINAKYTKNPDPMKKQQETMALYRKAGVNPLSGCLPLLLQFPILIALFAFLPAAIELRQQGFLWSDDLSTYDSVWTFGHVPVISSIYGDHVSLFALLMFISTLIYTWMNSAILTPQQNTQMPGMKFMMYFMPVIFLAVMNKYAAGLSWYYFLANVITFAQTWLMKIFIDDKKIRAGLESNMKKPVKKSSFQARLEEMAKQRQQVAKPVKKK